MAIFKREEEYTELTKEELLERILDTLYEDYEDWHAVKFKNAVYDLLLIKTFKKIVTKYINPGAPNPLHKEKDEEHQMVIAITIDMDHDKHQDKLFAATKSWTTSHIITDNVRDLVRELKQIDKENG